jgi:hypothetical protein
MVLVGGTGTVGLSADAYAIVRTEHLDQVDAPEDGCEGALEGSPEALACWVQTDEVDPVVAPRELSVEPFCIDAMPFPGRDAAYTEDGMTAWDAAVLSELLASGRFGTRRMCSFSEFQAAVAGLQGNRPFVYGERHQSRRCKADEPIGSDPDCMNSETGVYEYGAIQSHWVVADGDFVASACDDPPCTGAGGLELVEGHLVVAGGTSRLQTRQAPLTPHTWHDHGQPNPEGCDEMGHDDQPVICADPDPGYAGEVVGRLQSGELEWERFRWRAATDGSLGTALEETLGAPVCEL